MTVARCIRWTFVPMMLMALVPATAYAQASITGVVKDTQGAVMPGVSVEASSPALIERTRSVVSDEAGRYRLEDLRPGVYAVTFYLTGFNTFRRDGIELTGNFTASVNAELKVGSVEETIVVAAEAPIVDVQTVSRQRVLTNELAEALPTGKYFVNLGVLIPGVSASCSAACQTGTAQDTGGASGDNSSTLIVHGTRFRDQRISINDMTVRGATGYLGVTGPNVEAMQETQIDTSGADASVGTGGVRVNVVPKDGGNAFTGGLFVSGTNEHFQGSNIDQGLRDRGLAGTTEVKRLYDFAPTIGGPIREDKIWFFLSYRRTNNLNYAANVFKNANAGNPGAWTYVPDTTQRAVFGNPLPMAGVRLTWQASDRNKFAGSFDYRDRCQCPNLGNAGNFGIAPEAAVDFYFRPQHIAMGTWSSPVTNRMLLEATVARLFEGWGNRPSAGAAPFGTIRVVEQNPPDSYLGITTYRGSTGGNSTDYPYTDTGFTMAYVTGAHAFKAGVEFDWGYNDRVTTANLNGPITSIRLNSASGVPVANQFTVNLDPIRRIDRARADGGLFAQDRWTLNRLTFSGGLRLDFFDRYTPAVTEGATPLQPSRSITFQKYQVVNYKDLSPRMGAAWDLFGTGTTAVKVSLNRYVQDLSLLANNQGSPQQNYQGTASRSWTDNNKNFYPDCDFTNPNAQSPSLTGSIDNCGAFTGANANFGLSVPTSVDDHDVDFGFNHRGFNWEFSTALQQEIVPRRMMLDVALLPSLVRELYGDGQFRHDTGKLRRVHRGRSERSPFAASWTDDHVPRSQSKRRVASQRQPRQVCQQLREAVRTLARLRYQRRPARRQWSAASRGDQYRKQVTDNCAVVALVPEAATPGVSLTGAPLNIAGPLGAPFCHQATPWLWQAKGLASYTIPRVDVLIAGTFQSTPGPQLAATFVVPTAAIKSSLGRDLSGGANNVTVNILAPGTAYGDRLYQTDFRVGKVIRFGGSRRATASVDLYNLFDGNAVLQQNSTYSVTSSIWSTPQLVQQARLLKFTLAVIF